MYLSLFFTVFHCLCPLWRDGWRRLWAEERRVFRWNVGSGETISGAEREVSNNINTLSRKKNGRKTRRKDWLYRAIAGCFGSGWTRWRWSWTRCWRGRLENTESPWPHYRTACRYEHKWLVSKTHFFKGKREMMSLDFEQLKLFSHGIHCTLTTGAWRSNFKLQNVTLLGHLESKLHTICPKHVWKIKQDTWYNLQHRIIRNNWCFVSCEFQMLYRSTCLLSEDTHFVIRTPIIMSPLSL